MIEFNLDAVLAGYVYKCGCGEHYRTANDAWCCRKCHEYLTDEDFFNREVVDTKTGLSVPRDW